jgi:hypothetical protein
LEDFNLGRDIRSEAIDINHPDSKPEITLTFLLDKETFAKIAKEIALNLTVAESLLIAVRKTYPNTYLCFFPEELETKLSATISDQSRAQMQDIHVLHAQIIELHSAYPQIEVDVPDID